MRILVDMDEVLACWVERVLEWWNQDNGTALTPDDVKSWNIIESMGPEAKYFLRSCMRSGDFWDLKPIDGAIEGMKKLIDDGHDVIIVTAVPRHAAIAYDRKLEWLRKNMPFFPLNNFIAAQRKDLVAGDLLIDDNADNLKTFGSNSIAFDRPWNRDHYGLRVKNWAELLQLIEKMEGR